MVNTQHLTSPRPRAPNACKHRNLIYIYSGQLDAFEAATGLVCDATTPVLRSAGLSRMIAADQQAAEYVGNCLC